MKIYLIRHAHSDYGPPDPERTLSSKGVIIAEGMAAFFAVRSYFEFKEIWSSPYLRARQTAEPVLNQFNEIGKLEIHDDLVPHGDPNVTIAKLKKQTQSALVVGHNPHLTYLARALLKTNDLPLPFKKGAVLVLKRAPSSLAGYELSAYLTPNSLGL